MAPDADPYRTLGLPRGASLGEVKKAYRRLVKEHHPDAAGEANLSRFLAIQAAYDRIVGPTDGAPGGTRRPAAPRKPWDADPDRANATHRAYGGRSRRTRSSGSRPASGSTGSGAGRANDGPGPSTPPGADGQERPPNKATLGSTSYDGAEAGPFEPDWGGASWYGTTSGTYWTLNPKEYADPRKHGPEYQARARRAAAASAAREAIPEPDAAEGSTATADEGPAEGPGEGPGDAARPATPPASPPPTHTTTSWWDATAGSDATTTGDATGVPGPGSAGPEVGQAQEATAPTPTDAAAPGAGRGPAWLEGDRPGLLARIARAVLGWVPLALGIGWVAGEVTGCARFSADCDPAPTAIAWLIQLGLLAGLLALPSAATVAAIAGLATLGAAIPAAVLLTAGGAAASDGGGSAVLGGLLIVAWVVGVGIGLVRAMRRGPGPVS